MGITTNTSYEGQDKTDSLGGKLTFEQDNDRIIGRDADNLIRLLILANGTEFAMKVSKAGYDATTATADQLIFNSNQNIFKIVSTGTVTLSAWNIPATTSRGLTSALSNGNFKTVNHGITGTLSCIAFATDSNSSFLWGGANIELIGSGGAVEGWTNLYMNTYAGGVDFAREAFNSSSSNMPLDAVTIRYYILQETAV